MKKNNQLALLFYLFTGISAITNAQGLFDGFDLKKGNLSVTASYARSEYDEFYLGKEKQDAVPAHDQINQNIFSLYAKYGITNRLTGVINVPFISASNTSDISDPFNGNTSISGVQDISIGLKLNAYRFNFEKMNLNLITGASVIIPAEYESIGILSLGSGGFGFDIRTGLHLNTDSGFFSTVIGGYNFRGNAESSLPSREREKFGVPNSFFAMGKIGYASSIIYAEAWIDYSNSEEGVDIGSLVFTGNFPETNVDYARVGLTLYKDIIPKLGISLGAGKVIDGRNVGNSIIYSAGITYNMFLLN